MNIISTLTDFVGRKRRQTKERQLRRRRFQLMDAMTERVQLKEFRGHTYIALDGQPLIPVDLLKATPIETLTSVRVVIVDYKMRQSWKDGFDFTAR